MVAYKMSTQELEFLENFQEIILESPKNLHPSSFCVVLAQARCHVSDVNFSMKNSMTVAELNFQFSH